MSSMDPILLNVSILGNSLPSKIACIYADILDTPIVLCRYICRSICLTFTSPYKESCLLTAFFNPVSMDLIRFQSGPL